MCGIAGWVGPPDPGAMARMRAALRHRGPDDQGDYTDAHATLIHRRLSIIDVAGGHQPIRSEDGRFVLVFNGEIYNYAELRAELVGRGHRFSTRSDTEVIVHLFEELGPRCCERLTGMFAFAIWDRFDRSLFLARDRLGVKPLFYAQGPERFIFASELKAILAQGDVAAELDPEGVDHYLTFMYVPAPKTILKDVRKLPPGHTLLFRDGRARATAYWSLPEAASIGHWPSMEAAAEELEGRLQAAVRCRLMSEVPLGAYLSGGLDSSIVVGLMARASEGAVNTFSVGFEERGFDERAHARRVAEAFGTRHRELVVGYDSRDALPKIIRALDEPVADAAAIPTYLMAELTKRHVTVVLTGEGADELFAGYSHYKLLAAADRVASACPSRLAGGLRRLAGDGMFGRGLEYVHHLRDRADAWLALKSVFTPAEKAALYSGGIRDALRGADPPDEIVRRYLVREDGPFLNRLLRFDLATWLPDDLLVKVDRMTMAHAVEGRVPYLDHRVVEMVMGLPPRWKLSGCVGKRILRRVGRRLLPGGIARRPKTGFAVPVGRWAAGELRDLVREMLDPRSVSRRGLFRPEAVAPLLARRSYPMFQRRQLWTLLSLEMWCREFVDGCPARATSS